MIELVQNTNSPSQSYTLGIELIERCNFSCVHCYLERIVKPKINLQNATAIADAAYDQGFPFINLTGGEPMLHPQFIEIYEAFRKRGYIVSVFSNGSLITDRILDTFRESAPSSIEITLYGMSEATYRSITGIPNQFERVIKNIKRLRSEGINVVLKYHLLSLTKHEVGEYLNFARENGCDGHVNAQIIPKLNGDRSPLEYRLDPTEIAQIGTLYNIDFSPSGDGFEGCDAGKQLYIDSQTRVRGCAVLHTDFDITMDSDPKQAIENIKLLFEDFHRQRTLPLCPAWLKLEGNESVIKFLSDLITLPMAVR